MNCCHLDSGQTIYTWSSAPGPALISHWLPASRLDTGSDTGWSGASGGIIIAVTFINPKFHLPFQRYKSASKTSLTQPFICHICFSFSTSKGRYLSHCCIVYLSTNSFALVPETITINISVHLGCLPFIWIGKKCWSFQPSFCLSCV